MRSRARHTRHSRSSRNQAICLPQENAAAPLPATPRRATARAVMPSRPPVPQGEAALVASAELPAETDAWWLSRSQAPTFTRRRIALSDECARALGATGEAPARVVVEFNGASFGGTAVAATDGHYELDLGDALAQEMTDVLDEDDGLAIELVTGRGQPTLAIHPYVGAAY